MFARRLILFAIGALLLLLTFALGYASYPRLNGAPVASSAGSGDARPDLALFWEAWSLLDRDFFGEAPPSTQQLYGAIDGLTASFNDPYTFFVEPAPRQLERDDLRGRFGGVGANIEQTEAGYRLLPLPEQPAAQAGVEAGDWLVAVDGEPISLEVALDAVIALVRGEPGSTVILDVLRDESTDANASEIRREVPFDAEPLRFEITRAEIDLPSVEWRILDWEELRAVDDERAGEIPTAELSAAALPTIGYIQHSLFSERSAAEMRLALDELLNAGADRFLLDLRGNPGGLVDTAVAVADLWLDGGVVLYELQADGEREIFEASAGTLPDELIGAPLVVLVDGATASASEIVAGALQDRGRAVVLGEQTFGKGSVQLIYELADGSSLHVTNAQWLTPNEQPIQGQGLTPDEIIQPAEDALLHGVLRLLDGTLLDDAN